MSDVDYEILLRETTQNANATAVEATKLATAATLKTSELAAQLAARQGKVGWQIVTQAGVWLVSALLAYGALNARLQVLEVKYEAIAANITEVKADVKTLLLHEAAAMADRGK